MKDRAALMENADPRTALVVTSEAPAETLTALSEAGIAPVERLAADAFVVLVGPDELRVLDALPGLGTLDIFPATAKSAAEVSRTRPFEWQLRDGGTLAYAVQVYPGTRAAEIEALLDQGYVDAPEDYDPRMVEIVRVFTVVTKPDAVRRLAGLPFVARIEPAPVPDIPENVDSTQPLSNVDDVQIAPHNLSGSGINVGV